MSLVQVKNGVNGAEFLLPFNCPHCGELCFLVKNFTKKQALIIIDLNSTPQIHICHFMWQRMYYERPLDRLKTLTPGLAGLDEKYSWEVASRNVQNLGRAVFWDKNENSVQLVFDNGLTQWLEYKTETNILRGQLLSINEKQEAVFGTLKSIREIEIVAEAPPLQTLKTIILRIKGPDSWQLEQQILRIITDLKRYSQKPLLIESLPLDSKNGYAVRRITLIALDFTEKIVSQIDFPEWLKIKITDSTIDLQPEINF